MWSVATTNMLALKKDLATGKNGLEKRHGTILGNECVLKFAKT